MKKLLKYAFIAIIMFTCIAMMANNVQATDTPETTPGAGETEDGGDDGSAEEETETTDIEWTDFSNAKIELKKSGNTGAIIEISGFTPVKNSVYRVVLTNSSTQLEATEDNFMNKSIQDNLVNADNDGIWRVNDINSEISNAVELNQDVYVTIMEKARSSSGVEAYGIGKANVKLAKFAEPKYSDAFFATYVSKDSTQIVTNFTHAKVNARKMQIKIGQITDNSILQKIKNQDTTGFADLLKYARSNSGIYNQKLNANADNDISYNHAFDGQQIDLTGKLNNNSYYYLYVSLDDENGKYIPAECVTLALSNDMAADAKLWNLFFYGSSDFKWADFGTTGGDTPTQPSQPSQSGTEYPGGSLPQTGVTLTIVFATLGVVIIAIVFAKKIKKYTI